MVNVLSLKKILKNHMILYQTRFVDPFEPIDDAPTDTLPTDPNVTDDDDW